MNQSIIETLYPHADRLDAARPDKSCFADLSACGITLDASRQFMDVAAWDATQAAAKTALFDAWREALAGADIVNATEAQAATHMAARSGFARETNAAIEVEWADVVRVQMQPALDFAAAFRAGTIRGATGVVINTFVNLGIGGSDLGPRAVFEALKPKEYRKHSVKTVFVANLDPDEFLYAVADCDPATTLFCVASKSFSTLETLANANLAKAWLQAELKIDDVSAHFCAVSSKPDKAFAMLGIARERVFGMSPTVGGRYSVWTAIGLPIICGLGEDVFTEFCTGAASMDAHFCTAPFADNLPARLGALEVFNATALQIRHRAVIAYSQRLAQIPLHLQQLEMESNGKRVGRDGVPLEYPTAPAVLAGVGTQSQHAFFQWLHQGSDVVAHIFLALANSNHATNTTLANIAQSNAADVLLCAKSQADVLWQGGHTTSSGNVDSPVLDGEHGVYVGGKPVSLLTLDALTPFTLGALIAAFEHATFTAGVLWGINSFDQYGVELGKQMYAKLKENKLP